MLYCIIACFRSNRLQFMLKIIFALLPCKSKVEFIHLPEYISFYCYVNAEMYSEIGQTTKTELSAANYFCKRLHLRCLIGF